MKRPIITLLTDFGLSDYYVGAMKGVMLGICPDAQIVDITHDIGPYQIRHAAWMLEAACEAFPEGSVHVAVVDPGVGSDRRPILAEANGHTWVAPDNGLLTRVLAPPRTANVFEITKTRYLRPQISQTFHGRDIFAPVAAHLATGVLPRELGCPVSSLVRLPDPVVRQVAEDTWQGEILWVDRFGNMITSFRACEFSWVTTSPFEMRAGSSTAKRYESCYSAMEPETPHVIAGSCGFLEVSLNQQHAASVSGVVAGQSVTLARLYIHG